MTPSPPHSPGGPHQDQLRALTQEQMILAQAKSSVIALEPRMETVRACIETLEDALATVNAMLPKGCWAEADELSIMVAAMVKVQLIQLHAALKEGESNLEECRKVIAEIESPIKLFGRRG